MFSPKDFVLLNICCLSVYMCKSFGVRYIRLVKPIGILTQVLMSISFVTEIPTFLNISAVVWISVIFLVLRFSIMLASTYSQLKIKESFRIEQLKPELNTQVEHASLSLHF